MSAYAKSPWFPNSNSGLPFQLPVFWDLLTYPGSQPFSRPPLVHSPNIPSPYPTFSSTAHALPSASNAISFLLHLENSNFNTKPQLDYPSSVKPLCSFLLRVPHLILSHNPVYISSTAISHTIWNLQVCMSVVPLALQRGSIIFAKC